MNRKWMFFLVLAGALVASYGCPKKKPYTPAGELNVDTTAVAPAPAPAPATEVAEPAAPAVDDQTEDLLLSQDLQVVNQELRRRGFSPDVYFESDESNLSDETRDRLSRNADLLKGAPQLQLLIEGHADERGTNEYNLALGERRANAVKDYLASLGVSDARLRTLSYGEERPVCTEVEESCWSQNRRGHMVVTGRNAG